MFDDLRSSFEGLLKGELSFLEYINSLRGEKEYAIFAWDDPIPFFVYPFYLGPAALRRIFYKMKITIKRMNMHKSGLPKYKHKPAMDDGDGG